MPDVGKRGVLVRVEDVEPFCPAKHHETRSWSMLTRGHPPFADSVEISVAEIDPDGSIDEHVHPSSDHAYLVAEGRATAIVGGEQFVLRKGDCLYIPRGMMHELKVDGPESFAFVVFWTPARSVEASIL